MFEKPWHQLLINYIADPSETRTAKKFCEDADISYDTYHRFMLANHDEIYNEADKLRKHYQRDMRNAAIKALYSRLSKSDKAIELFFKLTGELVERTESRVEYMTPEQKRQRVAKALEALAMKRDKEKKQNEGDGVGSSTGL